MISIKVSDKFDKIKINEILKHNNISLNEELVNVMVDFYNKKQKFNSEFYYDENLKKMKDSYESDILRLKSEKMNITIEQLNSYADKRIEDIKKIYESINAQNQQKLTDLQKNMEIFTNKLTGTTVNKGQTGEYFVENYLFDNFEGAILNDMSKEGHKGDYHFKFSKLNTLFEIKNVNTVSKNDLQKFYDDVARCKKENNINSAIFVSLKECNVMPNTKNFHFNFISGVPCFYIGNVFQGVNSIKMAVLIADFLITNGYTNLKSDVKDENEEILYSFTECITDVFTQIKDCMDILEIDKREMQRFNQRIQEREKKYLHIKNIFDNTILRYPQFQFLRNSNQSPKDTKEDLILNLKKSIKSKDEISMKLLDELGYKASFIKSLGGIKRLKEMFSEEIVL